MLAQTEGGEAMTPSDRASVREAALREAANTCLSHNGCQRWGGLSCYSECHGADGQAILALIGHPAPDPPGDALTQHEADERVRLNDLEQMVRYAQDGRCMACGWHLAESMEKGCILGNCSFRPSPHAFEHEGWSRRQHVLALLAAPRTEGK